MKKTRRAPGLFTRKTAKGRGFIIANKRQEVRGNETASVFLGTHRLVVGGEGAPAAAVVAAGSASGVRRLGARVVRRRRRGAALEVDELGGDRHARRGRGVRASLS